MQPFSIVPPSHFGRRPRVRLSAGLTGNPFGSRWAAFMAALARVVRP